MAKRYKTKLEVQLIKALGELLTQPEDSISDGMAMKKKDWMVMDSANVCGVIPKTEQAKRLLARFIDEDSFEKAKIPELRYEVEKAEMGLVMGSKYSTEYVEKIVKVFSVFSKHGDEDFYSFSTKLRRDYPATFSNDELAFVLAPRVDSE